MIEDYGIFTRKTYLFLDYLVLYGFNDGYLIIAIKIVSDNSVIGRFSEKYLWDL